MLMGWDTACGVCCQSMKTAGPGQLAVCDKCVGAVSTTYTPPTYKLEDARIVELKNRVVALELLVLRLVQNVDRESHRARGRRLDPDLLTAEERKLLTEEPR